MRTIQKSPNNNHPLKSEALEASTVVLGKSVLLGWRALEPRLAPGIFFPLYAKEVCSPVQIAEYLAHGGCCHSRLRTHDGRPSLRWACINAPCLSAWSSKVPSRYWKDEWAMKVGDRKTMERKAEGRQTFEEVQRQQGDHVMAFILWRTFTVSIHVNKVERWSLRCYINTDGLEILRVLVAVSAQASSGRWQGALVVAGQGVESPNRHKYNRWGWLKKLGKGMLRYEVQVSSFQIWLDLITKYDLGFLGSWHSINLCVVTVGISSINLCIVTAGVGSVSGDVLMCFILK